MHNLYTQYMFHLHLHGVVEISSHPAQPSLPFLLRPYFFQKVLMFPQQLLCRSHVHTHFFTSQLLPDAFCPQQEPAAVLQEGLLILGLLQKVTLPLGLQLEVYQKPLHVLHLLRDGLALCRVGVLNTRTQKIGRTASEIWSLNQCPLKVINLDIYTFVKKVR